MERFRGRKLPEEEQSQGPGDKPPRAFYASDRRFVEVKEKQLGYRAGHDRMWDAGYQVPAEHVTCWCGSQEFVRQLSDALDDIWDYEENEWHGSPDCNWVEYGLLACEYL
ncbi:hypothetical protein B0T24DRAFT_600127 [Lasiosphaeria ovina]|uniref:Uncharacterized protein n=1 Tax=Lasiosphaeria ovina TaxID=92902 RepID=A0AAE0JRF4_9PEZI|nr:hypothetical protein B0T24DRAFT_600127 [Lasiosphaeria ovina]